MRPARAAAVRCCISIDVEEEGLFSGVYAREGRAANVRHLERLEFCHALGFPLTLLVDYPVTQDRDACALLRRLHRDWGAEIGAHLHHWNTPPLRDLPYPEPVRCHKLPPDLLREKLRCLTQAIERNIGVRPRSFRMGRFDYCSTLTPLLAELGYAVDSSMVPLRSELHGPDHFSEQAAIRPLGCGVTEVPLTVVPVLRHAPALARNVLRLLPYGARIPLQRGFSKVFAPGVHPLWYPLPSMKLAARLHLARGGNVLNVFLHSSELMPGGSPRVPDERSARALAAKLRAWLEWIKAAYHVQGATLGSLV